MCKRDGRLSHASKLKHVEGLGNGHGFADLKVTDLSGSEGSALGQVLRRCSQHIAIVRVAVA